MDTASIRKCNQKRGSGNLAVAADVSAVQEISSGAAVDNSCIVESVRRGS